MKSEEQIRAMFIPSIVGIETHQGSDTYEVQYVRHDGDFHGVGATCVEWIGHPDELRALLRRGPLNQLETPSSLGGNHQTATAERCPRDTLEEVLYQRFPHLRSLRAEMAPKVGSDAPPVLIDLMDLTDPRGVHYGWGG